ncbi:MAG: amidohydrolase family protein, partial [Pseudomonadota bacterium]
LHYHDYDLPSLEDLTEIVLIAHNEGRPVASHCVTLSELMLTLAAIEAAGPMEGDRIEHAAIASDEAIDWIARMGVAVVTQPGFIVDRLDAYEIDVDTREKPMLWRLASFLRKGVPLAAGSDAPFGSANPWRAMAAAVRRPAGFGDNETVSADEALSLFLSPLSEPGGAARRLCVGAPADICLLSQPWTEARADLSNVKVRATLINGALAYSSTASTSPQDSAS